nr:patatin-like phospholipase family protein [Moritella viscosa]SHO18074.1 Predicted protein [Moritella viscosa]
MRIGLVLSGGAAKGAYHVGILKALAEHDINVDVYSGASIGALNAVLSASASNIFEAHKTLALVWEELGKDSPIKINNEAVTRYLVDAVATLAISAPNPVVSKLASAIKLLLKHSSKASDSALLHDQPIIDKFNAFVDLKKKSEWKEVWVSTFQGSGYEAALEFVQEELGIHGKSASYHHLNKLDDSLLLETLLASAALPLLYQTRKIDGKTHYDGGIRDNTPIKPLLNQCDICFVSHLSNGSNFNRLGLEASNTQVIEIRPSEEFVTEDGSLAGAKAMLNFDMNKINYLSDMGYTDTCKVIKNLKDHNNIEDSIIAEDADIEDLLNSL